MAGLNGIVKLTPTQMRTLKSGSSVSVGGVSKTYDANTLYLVEDTPDTSLPTAYVLNEYTYGFTLGTDGWFTSNNAGIANSFAMCKLIFQPTVAGKIVLEYCCVGEGSNDVGIFGNLNSSLAASNTKDSTYAAITSGASGVKTVTYTISSANTTDGGINSYYIYIKYRSYYTFICCTKK